jgi:hypothetical protein
VRKYCGLLKNEIWPNFVFCQEMTRNNHKIVFGLTSVRSFVDFRFSTVFSKSNEPAHNQDHLTKFTALTGPKKAKFRFFSKAALLKIFFIFLWRCQTLLGTIFPVAFFVKNRPPRKIRKNRKNPKILKFTDSADMGFDFD